MRLGRVDASEKARQTGSCRTCSICLIAYRKSPGLGAGQAVAEAVRIFSSEWSHRLLRNDSMLEAILAKTGVALSRNSTDVFGSRIAASKPRLQPGVHPDCAAHESAKRSLYRLRIIFLSLAPYPFVLFSLVQSGSESDLFCSSTPTHRHVALPLLTTSPSLSQLCTRPRSSTFLSDPHRRAMLRTT